MTEQTTIPKQIQLPLRVAVSVVAQGIRIRFGRSLVTLSGVIFGIAFLMSILTGQLLKQGVRGEEIIRSNVNRMNGLLLSATGPLQDTVLTLHAASGSLTQEETRFLSSLAESGAARLEWIPSAESGSLLEDLPGPVQEALTPLDWSEAGEDTRVLILFGDGSADPEKINTLLNRARQRVTAYAGGLPASGISASIQADPVDLHPPERPEEAAQRAEDERREKFRFIWILCVSALVTIIGIANAMLMSVTERFREIGTMKCLGALSGFIRQIFLLESSLLGLTGSILGAIGGALFSILIYGFSYGFSTALGSLNVLYLLGGFFISVIAGILFSVVAALYPARVAARMVPAVALRSNV